MPFSVQKPFLLFFFLKILFMNSIISLKEGYCLCFIFSFLSSSFFSLYTLVCDPEMYLQFYLLNLNKLFIHKLCSHCPLLMICYIFRQQIFIYIVLLWIQNILQERSFTHYILNNHQPKTIYRNNSEILWVWFQTTAIKQILQ